MARDLKLAMTLLARDQGSKVLRQSLSDINRQINANKKASDDAARSEQENLQNTTRGSRVLQQEYRRAASARETLGIRSERTIQREISQTQAAYMRLLRTGTMTAQEQSRAFDAMTRKVANLRNELTGAGQAMSRFERARNWGSNATAIAGGVVAAGAVVAPSIKNQMSYEYRLADMANTAFADENIDGRRKGIQSMDQLIRRTVRVGGGTKETAADTLNALLASGTVDFKSAEQLLPMLQKYSTATGADSKDLAMIAIRLKQSFGVQDKDIPKAINMAIKAGQAGSFELADMAKYLPEQLGNASNAGMQGLDDFSSILALNQAAAITAGTSGEAGNNVKQLLGKISSADARNAASRIMYNGKGIDLTASMLAAQGRGMNSLDAFSAIIDKVVGNNPEYRKLENKLSETTDGTSRQKIMSSQVKFLEGSSVGQMVADQQALMALVAYRSNKKYANEVRDSSNLQRYLPDGKTAGDQNFELMKDTNQYKFDQFNNTRDFAQMDSVKSLSDITGKLSQDLNEYAGAYPGLTKAMAGAEIAIKAMTAAAITFAGVKFVSSLGSLTTGAEVASTGGGLLQRVLKTDGASALKFAGRWAGRIMAPLSLWQAANDAPLVQVERGDSAARARLQSGQNADSMSRLRDLKTGQPGLLDAWDEVSSWWSAPTAIRMPATANGYPIPPFAQPAPTTAPQPQLIQLTVDGKVLAEAVNDANSHNGSRGPQGGPH